MKGNVVTYWLLGFLILFSTLAQAISIQVSGGMTIQTFLGNESSMPPEAALGSITLDGDVIDKPGDSGRIIGKVISGNRASVSSFAGLTLGAALTNATITRITGLAFVENSPKTNMKRYYRITNNGGQITTNMTAAFAVAEEQNSVTSPFAIDRFSGSAWTKYYSSPASTGSPIHGDNAVIPVGNSSWALIHYTVDVATVYAKVFLQGAYVGNQIMRTSLRDLPSPANPYLPLTSPYSEAPKTVTSLPSAVTDWIVVSLRSTANGTDISPTSAFVRNDGALVTESGNPGVNISVPVGSYFIVIRHRNHLAVMSRLAVDLAGLSPTNPYDFTTLSAPGVQNNKYYYDFENGAVQFNDNYWAMGAADGTRTIYNGQGLTFFEVGIPVNDGSADAVDAIIFDDQQSKEGYVRADYSLDSSTDAIDAVMFDICQGRASATAVMR
jgi:hypothetical protein